MMNQTEKRNQLTTINNVEVRETVDGKRTVVGYAVKWGLRSHKIANRFFEVFQKGAFSEALKSNDIRALWSHDTSKILGRTKNNTLRLQEDDVGLRFELDLPNTTLGNDTFESIQRGDVDGVSFGFRAIEQKWDKRSSNEITRNIIKANLLEISPVGFPAYPDTQVSVRELDGLESEEKIHSQKRKRLYLQTLI